MNYLRDRYTCTDVDRCASGTNNYNDATCLNTIGSSNCLCDLGISVDAKARIDFDKCQIK